MKKKKNYQLSRQAMRKIKATDEQHGVLGIWVGGWDDETRMTWQYADRVQL